jgi:hypothetical protein
MGRPARQPGVGQAARAAHRRARAGLTTSFVREALHRAIVGVGPLPPASKAADAQLRSRRATSDRAVHEVIENHVRYAAAQGFVTNLGGLVTCAV